MRTDMSDWVIHFVHRKNPDNDAVIYDKQGDGDYIPFHADLERSSHFDLWRIKDEEQELSFEADAFSVLLRIIDDGHIRAGWSMRGGQPTIYGPRPACCFTEMPLYALLNYARERSDNQAVDVYGVAILKSELFEAGGRPVIYGLSGIHREIPAKERWPRMLHSSCGIAESEQYRYVAMNLGSDRRIDWSHEREWRWADVQDRCDCPGLSVWLQDDAVRFSRAVVIVRTRDEAERVLDEIAQRIDAKSHNYDYQYNRVALQSTRVLVLDEALKEAGRSEFTLRLDDMPLQELKVAVPVVPDTATVERVRAALEKAKIAADDAATSNPHRGDVFGFAYLKVDDSRSPIVQAMLRLKEVEPIGGIGYRLSNIGRKATGTLGQAEAAMEAAQAVLEKELPGTQFSIRTIWD
ncbi:MAG TPA: hypothetical protein VMP11_10710 [Verrucomicrobiae bacterium]|nr:hypothetical protein [Verrucomicrobiae bacterium]